MLAPRAQVALSAKEGEAQHAAADIKRLQGDAKARNQELRELRQLLDKSAAAVSTAQLEILRLREQLHAAEVRHTKHATKADGQARALQASLKEAQQVRVGAFAAFAVSLAPPEAGHGESTRLWTVATPRWPFPLMQDAHTRPVCA